jgi:hypothetical protein
MSHDIVILGCGRSGSSMVAGSIFSTGKYSMPGIMHPANEFNPKGFFETNLINKINDDILYSCEELETTQGIKQGWLSILPENTILKTYGFIDSRILEASKNKPFLCKDPRISYTLNCWLPFLKQPKIICVFRHPSEFLSSLIYHCQNAEYLKRVVIDQEFFEKIWFKTNNFILARYKDLNIMFTNYNQILYGDGLDGISDFIESKIDKDFPSKRLRNSGRGLEVQESTLSLYNKLCDLSGCPKEIR